MEKSANSVDVEDIERNRTNSSRRCCNADDVKGWFKNNAVVVATLVAVALGLGLGLGLRPLEPSYDVIAWISIWGELFLRMLKLIILPLVMACLVVGKSFCQ